ncbi:MAG: ion transporter [Bacteroidota bacterium]
MAKGLIPSRDRLHEIIFEADTPAGKAFDVALLWVIILSLVLVMLESVEELNQRFGTVFFVLEWIITVLFSIEYALRIYVVTKPLKYVTSFYGIVDLLSILPSYLSLVFDGTHYLSTIRALRLLRVFRVLKLASFMKESTILVTALRASRDKITVFLVAVLTVVMIIGSMMYWIEGGANSGFTSIPRSMYWAIVTITTVGYGDIAPATDLGQFLSAILMVMGYGVIAVPTGIIGAEISQADRKSREKLNTISCQACSREGHDNDAVHCKYCGEVL